MRLPANFPCVPEKVVERMEVTTRRSRHVFGKAVVETEIVRCGGGVESDHGVTECDSNGPRISEVGRLG